MLWAWSTGRLLEGATQEVIPIQVLVPTAWLASGFPILDGLCWLGFGDPGAQGCRKVRPCALLPREATKVTQKSDPVKAGFCGEVGVNVPGGGWFFGWLLSKWWCQSRG